MEVGIHFDPIPAIVESDRLELQSRVARFERQGQELEWGLVLHSDPSSCAMLVERKYPSL